MTNGHVKTVPEVIADLKEELKEFLNTRVAIFSAEMKQKLDNIKMGAPMLLGGLLMLLTAWFAFTGFVVCMIAQAFAPRAWAYVASFAIVTGLYAIAGGAMAAFAWKAMKGEGLKPERTINVLQQDRIWLQTEARTQL